jgi:hypothetical protein
MFCERNQSQWHFVHHKSHMGYPETEFGPPRLEADDKLRELW